MCLLPAQLHGLYLGPAASARAVLAVSGIASFGAPQSPSYQEMSWIDATAKFAEQSQVRTADWRWRARPSPRALQLHCTAREHRVEDRSDITSMDLKPACAAFIL